MDRATGLPTVAEVTLQPRIATSATASGKPEPYWQQHANLPFSEASIGTKSLSLIQERHRHNLIVSPKLRNSLLAGVGYLELANAGDFAANVWNNYPVPVYATVFMALGGTIALGMVYFAVQDARLSWDNICGLRSERQYLHKLRSNITRGDQTARALDCVLDMNFRETGTEVVDRIGMDICMGFGAFVVGVGTYMAIGGANPTVFQVSNLLSGYVGNGPCALYGLINLLWSVYVWRRECRHHMAGNKSLTSRPVSRVYKARISSLKLHSALNGLNGAIAGAASLVTATMWQGYLALAPCIIMSILINTFWRRSVGYTRPFIRRMVNFDEDTVISELLYIESCRQKAAKSPLEPQSGLLQDPRSVSYVIKYCSRHQLLEELGHKILVEGNLASELTEVFDNRMTITLEQLAAIDEGPLKERLLQTAYLCIAEETPKCFSNRERHLAEVLGCYLASSV
ncbi:hypothetical protein NLU13_7936 [Sarocladium strictum]|uniref:Integral membrane protein n=1 Tax=Sarocladium strictum TaxID=5046 RepID=A0AA39L673_SARSR|nr:hypothetical protein NLU13_7936 [Sarocladium strictum]